SPIAPAFVPEFLSASDAFVSEHTIVASSMVKEPWTLVAFENAFSDRVGRLRGTYCFRSQAELQVGSIGYYVRILVAKS
ncbi:MAG: hypothetical protein ACXWCX_24350, partial [Burkholderiales bacterium]